MYCLSNQSNSVFLSKQTSQNSVFQPNFRPANGAICGTNLRGNRANALKSWSMRRVGSVRLQLAIGAGGNSTFFFRPYHEVRISLREKNYMFDAAQESRILSQDELQLRNESSRSVAWDWNPCIAPLSGSGQGQSISAKETRIRDLFFHLQACHLPS